MPAGSLISNLVLSVKFDLSKSLLKPAFLIIALHCLKHPLHTWKRLLMFYTIPIAFDHPFATAIRKETKMSSHNINEKMENCPECRGTGKISAVNCSSCGGSGEIIIHSHMHSHGENTHDHPHPHDEPHHPEDDTRHEHGHG
jgi:hypothetical protein